MTAIGKLFVGGLAVLILAGAYGWYYFASRETPEVPQPIETPTTTVESVYQSQEIGLSFSYSSKYTLTERHDGFEGEEIHVLTLVDASIVVPDQSEGPVSIAVLAIPNPDNMPLEAWIKAKSISNFSLSTDKNLASTTVAGEPALSYRYSGLYENDAVAVMRGGTVYLFFVGWLAEDDNIRIDFQNILQSVTFIP